MKLVAVIFLIIAVMCLIHYIIIISYTGLRGAFAPFWLVSTIGFVMIALLIEVFYRFELWDKIPIAVLVIIGIIVAIPVISFLALLCMVLSRMGARPACESQVIIVLGAKVSGRRITKSLRKRLLKAEEYLKNHKDTVAIVSGGQGEGEDISEAEAMYDFLREKGIDSEQIIMEDKSTTTKENLVYSYGIIKDKFGESVNIVIVTNNFHIFRAEKLAKKMGINNIAGLAAPSDPVLIVNYIFRECAALVKEKMLGNI